MISKDEIRENLMPVKDPEIALSVIDLGLIYDIDVPDSDKVIITMTLTTPACPYGPMLVQEIKDVVGELNGVKEVKVDIVWDPPWNPEEMASDYAKDVLGIW